jgi:hypothetical protein
MNQSIKETLWRQFGASIDMLENAIQFCPAEQWDTKNKFWYISYHCLFWLDYYLTLEPDQFSPPSPFTLSEFNPDGEMPDRVYSKEELLSYLEHGRNKCYHLIKSITEDIAASRWKNEYKDYSVLEILLYNMRHVQHHSAQLNLLLRQEIDKAPKWVSIARLEMD